MPDAPLSPESAVAKLAPEVNAAAKAITQPAVAGPAVQAAAQPVTKAPAKPRASAGGKTAAEAVTQAASPTKTVRRAPKSKTSAKPVRKAAAKAVPAPAGQTVSGAASAKPQRAKDKLVRDSFTMPSADFALIQKLKDRALGFKRATKKSELLRAGLQALASLSNSQLQAQLGQLAAIKTGRPKKPA